MSLTRQRKTLARALPWPSAFLSFSVALQTQAKQPKDVGFHPPSSSLLRPAVPTFQMPSLSPLPPPHPSAPLYSQQVVVGGAESAVFFETLKYFPLSLELISGSSLLHS